MTAKCVVTVIGPKGLRMKWLCSHFLCYRKATHYLVYGLSRSRRCEVHARDFAAKAGVEFPQSAAQRIEAQSDGKE